MDVANILADHSYHKQLSKASPKDKYLGASKRHASTRSKPDGHKLTELNKKRVFVGLKKSKRREREKLYDVKPEITKISVPDEDTFMGVMGKQSLDPKHKWDVFEQVAAVITTGTNKNDSLTNKKQGASAYDNSIVFKTTDKSLPQMEAQFVDMGNVNQQFNKPDNAEAYSIVVPEW